MSQNIKPNGAEDRKNSESESGEKNNAWKNFEEFARKIFAVKPEELNDLPPDESEEKKPPAK